MGKGRDKKKKAKKTGNVVKEPKKQQSLDIVEEDIDVLLQEFTVQEVVDFPTRRANASLTLASTGDLFLFGGEHFNGNKVQMFNTLFKYAIDKNRWSAVPVAPGNAEPSPRSSHQIAATHNFLFMFGGEFISPNETSFFHYKDFWMFDLKTLVWDKLDVKPPPARSGHRMVAWKHLLVLFGGFYDTNKDTRYYDDLWVFDTNTYEWSKLDIPEPRPTPRSGFQFLVNGEQIFLYGGFCRVYAKGKKPISNVYTDIWTLKMNVNVASIKWERRKKTGGRPPGPRCGGTTIAFKGRGIMFGGVSDVKEDEETLESICHADVYQLSLDANKWFPLDMRVSKKAIHENEVENEPDVEIPPAPCPRFNSMLAISKNTLYLFGGIWEHLEKEITLNDMWSLNLDKMNGWNCLYADEYWKAEWLEDSSSSSDNDEFSDSDDGEDDASLSSNLKSDAVVSEDFDDTKSVSSTLTDREERKRQAAIALIPEPTPGESLGIYFDRTKIEWQLLIQDESEQVGKALRKEAFDFARELFQAKFPANELVRKQMEESLVIQKEKKESQAESNLRYRR